MLVNGMLLINNLASIEHDRWAHWQSYLHSKCKRQSDGSLVIPPDLVKRWERQMATPYKFLTVREKQSDIDQVFKYLPTIEAYLKSK